MNKLWQGIIAVLLVAVVGSAYGFGRIQGGKVGPGKAAATNLVQGVTIESTQKTQTGALYGDFSVVVQLKNPTGKAIRQLKVISQQFSSSAQYPTSIPKVDTKMLTLAELPAGKERTLRFGGFKVRHPDEQQEIVVNVVGHDGLGKLPYQAAFAPGSND